MRVLLIEDQPDDVILVQRQMVKDGLDPVVSTAATATEATQELTTASHLDLVLCDFVLPGFSPEEALALVREHHPDTPFLILSGRVRMEDAVEMMRQGATDFIAKDDLSRLGPSVRRALKDREERQGRRKAEAELLQLQKLEALGTMTAGIAHDFNNHLTAILGILEVLEDRLTTEADTAELLHYARQAAQGGAKVVEGLMSFSRKREMVTEEIDLARFAEDFVATFGATLGPGIELKAEVPEKTWPCKVDRGQLETALLNLSLNSRDAMQNFGSIEISAANVAVGPDFRDGVSLFDPGDYVMISVRDTGAGIAPEALEKIFEPFFTTKPPGKGTGLGMSMVYGFARQSRGHVSVSSEKGVGTAVRLYLPRCER